MLTWFVSNILQINYNCTIQLFRFINIIYAYIHAYNISLTYLHINIHILIISPIVDKFVNKVINDIMDLSVSRKLLINTHKFLDSDITFVNGVYVLAELLIVMSFVGKNVEYYVICRLGCGVLCHL